LKLKLSGIIKNSGKRLLPRKNSMNGIPLVSAHATTPRHVYKTAYPASKERYCDDRHKYSHKFRTLKVKNQQIGNFHFLSFLEVLRNFAF